MMSLLSALFGHQNDILFICAFLVIILSIVLWIILSRKNKKLKELSQAAEDKLRDESLNRSILNIQSNNHGFREVYVPYDVDYSKSDVDSKRVIDRKKDMHIMIQLIEKTELSTRKFMLNPLMGIRIGSAMQDNDIVISNHNVAPYQCKIFSENNKVYLKSLDNDNKTVICRKKEKAIVDSVGIRLLSKDRIILGDVIYIVTIKN